MGPNSNGHRAADWDAIVIGSGLGGLTTAAYLATNGVRPLVLEQYDVAGGCSHVFRRKNMFEFDVGVHYVGDCAPGGAIWSYLRGLGLEEKIEWLPMDSDGFDTLIFPGFEFRVPRGWDQYQERLIAAFPNDEKGIRKCVRVLSSVGEKLSELDPPITLGGYLRFPFVGRGLLRWGMCSLNDLFDACKLGPGPRAVLAGQVGTHNAPPSRAAVLIHAAVLHHYVKNGTYYPKGGGQVLAARLVEVIQAYGGQVRTHARVNKILVQRRRVHGVQLKDGETISSSIVISNADIKRTLLELVGREHLKSRSVRRIRRYRMALPLFCVYLGLDIDLSERIPNTNYWCFPDLDLEKTLKPCDDGNLPSRQYLYVSSASRKDPHTTRIAPPGYGSMEIMTVAPPHYSFWNVERGPASGERYSHNPKYKAVKERVAEQLVGGISQAVGPLTGLENHIVWQESATPITQERYTLSSDGASYGLEHSTSQTGIRRPRPQTEVRGLYLTGASTIYAHGIVGTMMGGLGTAGAILGRNLIGEVRDGAVFGDPSRVDSNDPNWDPLDVCRRLSKK